MKEEVSEIVEKIEKWKASKYSLLNAEKVLQDFRNIIVGYKIVDWTDKESRCLEYKILLHKNQLLLDDDKELINELGGTRKDLRIFISVIDTYYYMFVEETRYIEALGEWRFQKKEITYDSELQWITKRVDGYLRNLGYKRLFEKDVKMKVTDIEMEYKEPNDINVFDCLFTDLYNAENVI